MQARWLIGIMPLATSVVISGFTPCENENKSLSQARVSRDKYYVKCFKGTESRGITILRVQMVTKNAVLTRRRDKTSGSPENPRCFQGPY